MPCSRVRAVETTCRCVTCVFWCFSPESGKEEATKAIGAAVSTEAVISKLRRDGITIACVTNRSAVCSVLAKQAGAYRETRVSY